MGRKSRHGKRKPGGKQISVWLPPPLWNEIKAVHMEQQAATPFPLTQSVLIRLLLQAGLEAYTGRDMAYLEREGK